MPDGSNGLRGSNGTVFLLTVIRPIREPFVLLCRIRLFGEINHHQMIIRAPVTNSNPRHELLGQRLSVFYNLMSVLHEIRRDASRGNRSPRFDDCADRLIPE